ncbi:MAG TPA: HD domain-containing phosphohydrolase [Nocardioidaceae bacterium]|nr:HD domain-containing phosphohydrolase [Nocardioidaceae bacterium]
MTELVAAISLATDLGTGQPIEHALRTCRLSLAVADELGLDPGAAGDVHYVALLRFLGCTADAPATAWVSGGDNLAFLSAMAPVTMGGTGEAARTLVRSVGPGQPRLRRARLAAGVLGDPKGAARSMSAHCEVGARLAVRLGLGPGVVDALSHAYERWDGRGVPDGLAEESIPIAVRVVVVARGSGAMATARRHRGGAGGVVPQTRTCLRPGGGGRGAFGWGAGGRWPIAVGGRPRGRATADPPGRAIGYGPRACGGGRLRRSALDLDQGALIQGC